jgi:hypothetical protein
MPIKKQVTLTGTVEVTLDDFSYGEKEQWALSNGFEKIDGGPIDPPIPVSSGYIAWLPGGPTSPALIEANPNPIKQSNIDVIASQCWQADMSHCMMSTRYKFNPEGIRRDIRRIKVATGKQAAFVATTTDVSADFEFLENDDHYGKWAGAMVQAAQVMMTDGDRILVWDNEIYSRERNGGWANYWGEQKVSPLKAYQRGYGLGVMLPRGLTFYFNHGIEKAFSPTDTNALHANARGNNPNENRSLGHFLAGLINGGVSVGARVIECAQLYGLRGDEFTRLKQWVETMKERDSLNPSSDGLNHWKQLPFTFMAYTNPWSPALGIGRGMNPAEYTKLLKDINRQKDPNTHTVIYGEWFGKDANENKAQFDRFWNPNGDWQKAIKGQL